MPPRACARRPFEKSASAGLRECPHALRWAPARDPFPASVTEPRREDGEVHDEKEGGDPQHPEPRPDRKSTRLNSSHQIISYAVFCLKKKKSYYSRRFDGATCDDISSQR